MSDSRRGYTPSEYVPSGYDDDRRARNDDRYTDDAIDSYKYSRGSSGYDGGADRQAGALSRDPYYNRDYADDDDYYGRRYDPDDRRSTRSRSRPRSKSKGRDSSRKSGDRYPRDESDEERDDRTIKGHFGKERKDLAATAIGVVAGAFLGHEAGKKHGPAATIGGALLGGLAANAIEHQHLKRQQEKKQKKLAYEEDYDDDDDGYYGRR